jgi:hypothetical protein
MAFVVDVMAYVRKRGTVVPILNLSSTVFRGYTDLKRFWCINYFVFRIDIVYILAYTASEST